MSIVANSNTKNQPKYVLGSLALRTKSEVIAHCRGILKQYEPLESLGGDDFHFVCDLIARHECAQTVIGEGIIAVEVYKPERWEGTRTEHKGFRVLRSDGSVAIFSFHRCLTPATAMSCFKEAARLAVYGQTVGFAQKVFGSPKALVYCPCEKRRITWAEHHVDHEPPPFCDLLTSFIVEAGIDVDKVKYVKTPISVAASKEFLDSRLVQAWQEYHRKHAVLRVISKRANQRKGRRNALSAIHEE